MSDLLTLVASPLATNTSGIAVGDNDQWWRVRDIDPLLPMLNQDDGTYYKILSMLPNDAPATQPKYEWGEDDITANSVKVNGAQTSSDTSIEVDNGLGIVANSILTNARTRERIIVTSVSTNTLTVTRGFSGSGSFAMLDDDDLIFGGDTLPELADANAVGAVSYPTEFYNYIQRWSKTFSISNLQDNVEMFGGVGTIPREAAMKMIEMKRQINAELLYGKKGSIALPSDSTQGIVYTTEGIFNRITTNELNLDGNNGLLDWPVLNHFLNPLFHASASSPSKLLVCGENLFSALTRMAWDRFNFRASFETTLGSTFTNIKTDQGGSVDIVLDRHGFPAGTAFSGAGVVVDLAHVALKEMRGEPLAWRQNIQDNDAHVRRDELWGTASCKIKHEETHGVILGASGQY